MPASSRRAGRLIPALYTCMSPPGAGGCSGEVDDGESTDRGKACRLRLYPLAMTAFAFVWVGVIWPFDLLWARSLALPAPLIGLTCALAFMSCGLAMMLAHRKPYACLAAAVLAMAFSAYGFWASWVPGTWQLPSAPSAQAAQGWTVMLMALAGAVYLSTLGTQLRRLAWCIGLAIVLGAIGLRLLLAYSDQVFTSPTTDIAVILMVFGGGAVMALSRHRQVFEPLTNRITQTIVIVGSFVAVGLWFVLTNYARAVYIAEPWQDTWQTIQAQFVLIFGLTFTYMLARSHRLASDLIERSRELRHASLHDCLTDLPNKRYLAKKLCSLCRATRARHGTLHVVLIDLEGVKLINDSMGHSVGDIVLKEVTRRIVEGAGPTAFVARLEGDEFVLVFTEKSDGQVRKITQELIDIIGRSYHVKNAELRVSASAGITASDGHVGLPLELVSQADLAVTRAKRDGGRTWYEYCASLRKEVTERLAMSIELQNALENDILCLHYQPVVDGHMGRIVGAEALLRWSHSDYGNIPPAMFIPLAEETGQIIPLSLWVLDRACRDVSSLRQRSACDFPVLINISPLYFHRSDFVSDLEAALTRYNLPPESLQIEITEGVLLDSAETTISKLAELKELGVKVSIDDFGTGYSSLNYLKNLPIDKIKIDRSFVNDVISDRHDAAITKAIIGLAHHLNLKVVAEGVETESQFWFLKRNFCDEFQGFFFDRPMPWEDFSRRLLETGGRVELPQAYKQAESARTLLIVDDEENILRALTRLLRRDGYNIVSARSPAEAFAILASQEVQVILSDQRMPGMTGTEFFSRVKQMYPRTVRLILSGYTELRTVTEAINHGAIYRYLTKPWDDQELRDQVADAFNVISQPASNLMASE